MLRLPFSKTEGKIDFDREVFNKYLSELNNGKYIMEVKKYFKKRTGSQNRYYFAILEIIGNELGYEKEELHYTFKHTYLGEIDKYGLLHAKSTTENDTKTMGEYLDKIIMFAAKNGIVIPDQNEYL